MSKVIAFLDTYRRFARRHPLRFIGISIISVCVWVAVIMRFSGENADVSGNRSARVLVGIINAVAPGADVTLDNYEQVPALHNSEKVVRKLAHMFEYGILTALVWSLLFGFRNLPRKYSYIVPVVFVFCLGVIDEKRQSGIEGRYGSWFDVCVDTVAAIVIVLAVRYVTNLYRRRKIRENNSPHV